MMLKWLVTAVIVYGGFVALLYLAQRLFQYFPERRRTAPSAVGLSKAEEVVLDTADGERVIVWHAPPADAVDGQTDCFSAQAAAFFLKRRRAQPQAMRLKVTEIPKARTT
jgi:hypothetical protein